MDELIAFVRAQLDEDERVAREADPHPWTVDPADGGTSTVEHAGPINPSPWVVHPDECGYGIKLANAEHIARWDPARVLAEVEAKRRVLDWCERAAHILDAVEQYGIDPSDVVEQLAQPYAGQPGWREAWRA